MDSLKEYFSNYINITNNSNDRIKTVDLFVKFSSWLREKSINNSYNQRSFNRDVKLLGFEKRESNGKTFFPGISFKIISKEVLVSKVEKEEVKKVLDIPKEAFPSSVKILSQEAVVPKKSFIKFSDFILHVPTFIAVKGSYPSNVAFLLSYPFKLSDVIDLLADYDVHNLSVHESGNLYFNFNKLLVSMKEKKLSLESSVVLLFSTGFDFARFRFDRNLLVCDSYDEFYSYCKNNSLII